MLQSPTPFPTTGSLCFRTKTAEPARVLRHNGDGTVLLVRHRRLSGGGTMPLEGASANTTVPVAEIFADPEVAMHGSKEAADKARRTRAAGGW